MSDKNACNEIIAVDLESITALNFDGGIATFALNSPLKNGDFAGLTGLTILQLQGNSLTTLPADIFSGLSALQGLNLRDNQLSALPTGFFSGLTSLTFLSLEGNNPLPASLPASLFADVPRSAITLPTGTTINEIPTTVGTIADIDLVENGNPQTVDVANKFSDTTGDTLTYTVESNNTATVTVAVSGSAITITPVAIGTADITITATDTAGQTATQTLMVSVNAQETDPTDLCSRSQGVRDEIVASVNGKTRCQDITPTDLAGITGLRFIYTSPGGGRVRDDLVYNTLFGTQPLQLGIGAELVVEFSDIGFNHRKVFAQDQVAHVFDCLATKIVPSSQSKNKTEALIALLGFKQDVGSRIIGVLIYCIRTIQAF